MKKKEEEFVEEFVRVASKSDSVLVARAVTAIIRNQRYCPIYCIGPIALSTAIKAVAITRGHLAPAGHDIICTPAFEQSIINGEEKTVMKIIAEPRH